jgi:tetratricopeptide (TPR) repeat protein
MGSVDSDLMRASLLLASDPAAAAGGARRVLAISPEHVEANLLLAAAALRLGDPAGALAVLEPLAADHRSSAIIHLELGKAYAAAGRGSDAIVVLRRAVDADARLAEAWKVLASQLYLAGDEAAGDRAYGEYCALTPDPAELGDARMALADNRLRAAESLLLQRLRVAPLDAIAMRMLAEVSTRRDNLPEAEQRLNECLAMAPGFAAARYELARVLSAQQKYPQALLHLERLLASQPQNTDYLTLKTHTLRFLGRHPEAIALAKELIDAAPDEGELWLNYGHLLRGVGKQAESVDAYRRAIRVGRSSGRAYWSLANLKTFRFDVADIEDMRARLGDARESAADRVALEFSLGKALEDATQFAEAYAHYERANSLHRAAIAYDPDRVDADVRRSKAVYTERFFAERAGWGTTRRDPIFIVGLPRSGSTLLEQMLASHSQVEATHELADISAIASELMGANNEQSQAYPRAVEALTRPQVDAYAARYLARTQHYRRLGKDRFVDKMLANFGHAGLIHLMFPHAAIIDIRRHPMASCFSCYRQYFAGAMNFAYDLGELGRYYRAYAELMDHLESVLPGRVLRVRYEDLVADTEAELRRVLDHCRLPFEAGCLRYYATGRVVQTISSEQVRRPIYTDSVDEWRNFEPWLGRLKDALGGLGG